MERGKKEEKIYSIIIRNVSGDSNSFTFTSVQVFVCMSMLGNEKINSHKQISNMNLSLYSYKFIQCSLQ